jgi:CHASE3 domain sensor protein
MSMRCGFNTVRDLFLKRMPALTHASAYWLGVAPLIVVGIVSYFNTTSLIERTNAQHEVRNARFAIYDTFAAVKDAETGQRGYLLTGRDSYLAPYNAAVKVVDDKMNRVEGLLDAVPDQREKVESL